MLQDAINDPRWKSREVRTWTGESKKYGVTLEFEIAELNEERVNARACGRVQKTGAIRISDINTDGGLRHERTPGGVAVTKLWIGGGLNRAEYTVQDDGRLRWKTYSITRKGKRKEGVDLTLEPGIHERGCLRWTSAPSKESG